MFYNFPFLVLATLVIWLMLAAVSRKSAIDNYRRGETFKGLAKFCLCAVFVYMSAISVWKVYFYLTNFDRDVIVSGPVCFTATDEPKKTADGRCIYRSVQLRPDAFEVDFVILDTGYSQITMKKTDIQIVR